MKIMELHNIFDSVKWRLTTKGIEVEGRIPRTPGYPATVSRIWKSYRNEILDSATEFNVPVELIIATIATESRGKPNAYREEPGFKSVGQTPHRVSIGLMQTLVSTAQMWRPSLKGQELREPAISIKAGTYYIAHQRGVTNFDPPLVGAAYNAGGVYHQKSEGNRWKTRQFPIGTSKHVDRFVEWYNDAFALFELEGYNHSAPSQFVDTRGTGAPVDRKVVEKELQGKSRTIDAAKKSNFWAKLQAVFGAIFGLPAAGATVLDAVTDAKQKTDSIGTVFGITNEAIFAVLGALAVVTAVLVWYNNRKVIAARVEDAISGVNVD